MDPHQIILNINNKYDSFSYPKKQHMVTIVTQWIAMEPQIFNTNQQLTKGKKISVYPRKTPEKFAFE